MKIALFDLDSTLLPIDSDHAWGAFTQKLGWVDGQEFARKNDEFYKQYQQQILNIDEYILFSIASVREKGMQAARAAHAEFMQQVIIPEIMPQARALVNKHLNAGDECILVTATNDFVTAPIAAEFGFKHLIATELEKDSQGEYTGRVKGVPSFQNGKVERVTSWLQERGHDWDTLQDSTFYSDSINDLPLLSKVKRPVATNPDSKLEAIALERDWTVLRLFE